MTLVIACDRSDRTRAASPASSVTTRPPSPTPSTRPEGGQAADVAGGARGAAARQRGPERVGRVLDEHQPARLARGSRAPRRRRVRPQGCEAMIARVPAERPRPAGRLRARRAIWMSAATAAPPARRGACAAAPDAARTRPPWRPVRLRRRRRPAAAPPCRSTRRRRAATPSPLGHRRLECLHARAHRQPPARKRCRGAASISVSASLSGTAQRRSSSAASTRSCSASVMCGNSGSVTSVRGDALRARQRDAGEALAIGRELVNGGVEEAGLDRVVLAHAAADRGLRCRSPRAAPA